MKDTLEQNALLKGLTVGMEFLIEDGRRKLRVTERVSDTEVKAEVLVGGRMKARQGVNVPDLDLKFSALTAKDRQDLKFFLKHKASSPHYILHYINLIDALNMSKR